MLKRIIPLPINLFLLLILFSELFATHSTAMPKDNEQTKEIKIQSDTAEFNDKQGIATYRGHVIMEQGLTQVTSDTLVLFRDSKGKIKSIMALGNPAYFTQDNDTISGNRLIYDLETKILSSAATPGASTKIFLFPEDTHVKETSSNEQS